MLSRPLFCSLMLFGAAAAPAAEGLPARSQTAIVYGNDTCPEPVGDEIVVCARKPESERYRIPEELRKDKNARPSEISWASRAQDLEDASRPSRPGSCSVVGSGGQSGCMAQMMRQWFAERRSRR